MAPVLMFSRIMFFEPTDVPVSIKPFQTPHWKAVKYITPNALELKEIASALNISLYENNHSDEIKNIAYVAKSVTECIPNVIVTLGSKGLLLVRKGCASDPLLHRNNKINTDNVNIQARHYPAETVRHLINVSGAGDCLASGLIAAMLKGLTEQQCVSIGYAAAQASLNSPSPVPATLFNQSNEAWTTKAKYETLF